MIGNIAQYIAFFTALAAGILFLMPLFNKKSSDRNAVYLYYTHTAAVLAASAYLLYALLTHQFQYYYVYAHTELSLQPIYLFSAFWAGQEGSYLFWVLCGAISGLFLLKMEQKIRHLVMPIFLAGQAFLMLFLLLGSPFELLPSVPVDGTGMNPLLVDPWMVIHPPIVFIGYALLIIPFAYAVAALYKKDYQTTFLKGLPWAVGGWLFLGAGIFIGGVWAYRVLGWGGYWGWDPVENASLVPWLTCTALVHGMILQRQKQIYTRFNSFLAIITYLLVVFATFLTRSGAMAEYSVHAFPETPLRDYLTAFMVIFGLLGFLLFALRYREMGDKDNDAFTLLNRPGSFGLTLVALCTSALLVLVGTLSPLLTGLFGTPSSVDEFFYWSTNAPVGLVLLILLGLCPYFRWKKDETGALLKLLKLPLALSAVATVVALIVGVRSLFDLLFMAAGTFALVSNTDILLRVLKKQGVKFSGGYLAHMGLALMFIGMMASTNYTLSHIIHLSQDRPVETLGYTFTYMGHIPEGEKFSMNVLVGGGNISTIAAPKMYYANDMLMREPAILRNLWRDLYISPMELTIDDHSNSFTVAKGQVFDFEDYNIKFVDFSMQPHEADGSVEIGAILEVRFFDEEETIMPIFIVDGDEYYYEGALLPGSDVEIYLEAVDASEGLALFAIDADCCPGEEILAVEVKIKPFISILGFGTALLIIGTTVAFWRRFTIG